MGTISVAHASVLAHGTRDLPDHLAAEAEPVLVEAAARLDPPRLRRVLGHLRLVADPDGADAQAERRHQRRGLWLTPTFDGMVAIDGLVEPEAGQTVLAALEPLARPTDANDHRSGSQRTADALTELARRNLEAGQSPTTGGVRPQLSVVVDLDSLLGHPGSLGGELGWAGPMDPEACRRLACDSAVSRVIVTRPTTERRRPRRDRRPGGAAAGGQRPGCRGSWVGPPASPWTSGAAAESSNPASVAPWGCGTAAVSSPTAPAPWPGARPTICATGSTAAPPTSPTSPCSAEPITGRSMRAAGDSARSRTALHRHPTTSKTPSRRNPRRLSRPQSGSRPRPAPAGAPNHPRPNHRARQLRGARTPRPRCLGRHGARTPRPRSLVSHGPNPNPAQSPHPHRPPSPPNPRPTAPAPALDPNTPTHRASSPHRIPNPPEPPTHRPGHRVGPGLPVVEDGADCGRAWDIGRVTRWGVGVTIG